MLLSKVTLTYSKQACWAIVALTAAMASSQLEPSNNHLLIKLHANLFIFEMKISKSGAPPEKIGFFENFGENLGITRKNRQKNTRKCT